MNALKKQMSILKKDLLYTPLFVFGVGLAGIILHYIIVRTDDTTVTCFPMGTLLAMIMLMIVGLILAGMSVSTYFNVEISMGSTRRQFFWTYYFFYVLYYLLAVCILAIFNEIENYVLTVLYPAMEIEIKFTSYIWKYGILIAVAMPILSILFGMLILHFGTKAFWVLWALWMFGCIGIPRIIDAVEEAPQSLFGRIGTWVGNLIFHIPSSVWIGVALIGYIVCMISSWKLMKKQQVTM